MTEALKLDNTSNSIINMMLGANEPEVDIENQNFSKLIDNINSKKEEVQTKFISETAKTNTSSINKKALVNDVDNNTLKTDIKTNESEVGILNEDIKIQEVNTEIENKLSIEEDEKEVLSDINYNSPVEPSPVFSFETSEIVTTKTETKEENKDQKEELQKNDTIAATDFTAFMPDETIINSSNFIPDINIQTEVKDDVQDDFENEIDKFSKNLKIDDKSINTIEKIASALNKSELSNGTDSDFDDILNKFQTLVEKIKKENQERLNSLNNQEFAVNSTDEAIAKLENLEKELNFLLNKINNKLNENDLKIKNNESESDFNIIKTDKSNEISFASIKTDDFKNEEIQQFETLKTDKIFNNEKTDNKQSDNEIQISQNIKKEIQKEILNILKENNVEGTAKTLETFALKDFEKNINNDNLNENENQIIELNSANNDKSLNSLKKVYLSDEINSKSNNEIADIDETVDDAIDDIKLGENNDISNDILDEILEEIIFSDDKNNNSNLKISGALSVSDEIIKLSLDNENQENNILFNNLNNHFSKDNKINTFEFNNVEKKPLEESNLLSRITDRIQQLKDGSGQKLTMVLRPNDLGRLSIELITNSKGLTTNIVAQNTEVRNYIENNINSLRQQLVSSGVNVNTIQIKTMGESDSSTYDNQNFNQGENPNQNQSYNQGHNQEHNFQNRKDAEFFINNSTYDMEFSKDFSSVLSNTLNYSIN